MRSRPRALAVAIGALLALGLAARALWPTPASPLTCPDGGVHLDADGVARCGPGAPLPAGQAMTLGQKVDLNRASAADLALVPGVGPSLAQALVAARTDAGGFTAWAQVDAVPGVGETRLMTLQEAFEIRTPDGGTW